MTAAKLGAVLQLTRLRMAGLATAPYVVGGLAVHVQPRSLIGCWLLGLGLHSYACVVNDLADRRYDALNPDRSSSPLVTGAVSQDGALFLGLVHVLVLTFFVAVAPASLGSRVALIAL